MMMRMDKANEFIRVYLSVCRDTVCLRTKMEGTTTTSTTTTTMMIMMMFNDLLWNSMIRLHVLFYVWK